MCFSHEALRSHSEAERLSVHSLFSLGGSGVVCSIKNVQSDAPMALDIFISAVIPCLMSIMADVGNIYVALLVRLDEGCLTPSPWARSVPQWCNLAYETPQESGSLVAREQLQH